MTALTFCFLAYSGSHACAIHYFMRINYRNMATGKARNEKKRNGKGAIVHKLQSVGSKTALFTQWRPS